MAGEKDQTEIDLKIKAALMRLDQCHVKRKQEVAELISKNKSESETILAEIEALMKLQEDTHYEREKERLSRKSTMADKDLDAIHAELSILKIDTRGLGSIMNQLVKKIDDRDKLIREEVGRWNEFMESFLLSRERTNVKSSTQIDSAKKSAHPDEFKKEENIGNKGSKTGVGEKDLKIAADCDQLESRNMEESDQEMQESVLGSEEHYVNLMNSTIAAIFDQSKNSEAAFRTSVEDFSKRMYTLIHGMKADFKKDLHGAKKTSVLKWLKQHAESKEDYEAIKAEVGKLATKLLTLLSTLMLLMLESEEMHAKLQVFKSSIKWLIEDADSLVTRMIVSVMETIEYRVKRQRKIMVESRQETPVSMDMTIHNQFERVVLQILDGIKHLDCILMHQGQNDSNESVNDFRKRKALSNSFLRSRHLSLPSNRQNFPETPSNENMTDYLLTTTPLTKKKDIDSIIRDTIDKVLVLRFGRASDPVCLHLDDILSKSAREVSKFATIALVDIDSEDVQVYIKYFDITLVPSTVFFFNAHHMKMDSGTADHTKWVGAFHRKQDFIDVVEAIFRGAMKGKLIVNCPLPPERIPKYQLLYKDL
ncbi:unnamed protein product [Dovyalis caffra]|uniref:Thioredoxin-like protein 4B n=1 Tax=Dovyalis caffra TaxID=77055 RepID=A0AAV1RDD9_9ROSI|nr:unnamed protein product [Dovyalis caffra]